MQKFGVEAVPVAWDAAIDWSRFDQIILRSCWDYHLRTAEFLAWISDLDRLCVPIQNSARLVRWNADKRYLRNLNPEGSVMLPTVWIEEDEETSVQSILQSRGWDSAVVKPTVSA